MPLPNGQPTMMEAILAGQDVSMTVGNREMCFSDPVKSMIDGKYYNNRKDYQNHLKQHGCVEVGNEYNGKTPKRELRGDFNVRKELTEATREVLSRT